MSAFSSAKVACEESASVASVLHDHQVTVSFAQAVEKVAKDARAAQTKAKDFLFIYVPPKMLFLIFINVVFGRAGFTDP